MDKKPSNKISNLEKEDFEGNDGDGDLDLYDEINDYNDSSERFDDYHINHIGGKEGDDDDDNDDDDDDDNKQNIYLFHSDAVGGEEQSEEQSEEKTKDDEKDKEKEKEKDKKNDDEKPKQKDEGLSKKELKKQRKKEKREERRIERDNKFKEINEKNKYKINRNLKKLEYNLGKTRLGRGLKKGADMQKKAVRATGKEVEKRSRMAANITAGAFKSSLLWVFFRIGMIIKALTILIILVIVIRFLLKLREKYPRYSFISSGLDISGKFSKSIGLDIEMSKIVSKSLTDYIYNPDNIINTISNTKHLEYIKFNLFNKYNYNNALYKLLRKFIVYKDDILKQGFKDNKGIQKEYINSYYSEKVIIPGELNITEDGINLENNDNGFINFLMELLLETDNISFEIDTNLIRDAIVIKYIHSLYIYEPDTSYNNDYNNNNILEINGIIEKLNMSYDDIKNTFEDILSTKNIINQDASENIFYRNVLYYIIYVFQNVLQNINDNSIEDKDFYKDGIMKNTIINQLNNIDRGQLEILEENNPLSYIDIDVDYNNLYIMNIYGKYLHMPDSFNVNESSVNITLFKDIFDATDISTFIPNLNLNYDNEENNISIADLSSILREDIKLYLDYFLNSNEIKNNYEYIFNLLNNNCEIDKVSSNWEKWEDVYDDYKFFLDTMINYKYKTENILINKIYELDNNNGEDLFNSYDISNINNDELSLDDRKNLYFNMNLAEKKTKSILELFNSFIVIENFNQNYENVLNNTDFEENSSKLYEFLLEYLWNFEYFINLTYYSNINSNNPKYIYIIEEQSKNVFLNNYYKSLQLSLYFRDKDIINSTIYIKILYKLNNSNNTNVEIKQKLKHITGYYLSFMEIKLFANYINDLREYKKLRTGFNIINDYVKPEVKYYFKTLFMNNIFKKDMSFNNLYNIQIKLYKKLREIILDPCTYMFTKKLKKNCSNYKIDIPNELFTNNKIEEFKNIEEPFLGGLKKALRSALKPIGKFIADAFSAIPVFREFLKILHFIIAALKGIKGLGFGDILFLILGAILYFSGLIVGLIFFTTKKWGIACIILMIIVVPLVFFICILKGFFVLIITAVIIILGTIVYLIDQILNALYNKTLKEESSNNDNSKLVKRINNNNIFSKFIYRRFIACENNPHSWYKNSRYDLENKSSRGFFCRKPCVSNYRLSDDSNFCEKAPTNVPYYCPQPLLFRYYRNEPIYGINNIEKFISNNYPILLLSDNNKQIEFINKFKKDKQEYYNSCMNPNNTFYQNYNPIGKNICAYGNSNNYNSTDSSETKNIKNNISLICKQTYCQNGNYENFCYKYDNIEGNSTTDILNDNNKLTKYLKYLIFIILIFAFSSYFINLINSVTHGHNIKNPLNINLLDKINTLDYKGFNNFMNNIRTRLPNMNRMLMRRRRR